MNSARMLVVEATGAETAAVTFARDELAALGVAHDGIARARIWHRDVRGLVYGRFHRMDASAAATGLVSRRLSGGRIVVAGPGIVCITLVVPLVDWLDPGGAPLRPDQVLNRALRPLLATLRDGGIDAFYPGRDLVTAGGRALAHASFTVMRDGVGVVEVHVADSSTFRDLPGLLDHCDPAGAAGVDRAAFADATSIAEVRGGAVLPGSCDEWAAAFSKAAAAIFACEIAASDGDGVGVTLADASAAHDFFRTPGPLAADLGTAVEAAMLGVVECAGRFRGDRLASLEITGDLIAPFHTIDDIACECEGEPFRPPSIRKALARALARPRSFVLGIRELDQLILRIA